MKTSYFKSWIIVVGCITAIMLLLFLGIAFIKAEINPFKWGEGWRTMFVFIGMVLFSLSFPITGIANDN